MSTATPSLSAAARFPEYPPEWADAFGEDECGLFAECTVQGALFVWRWLPPGTFLMGSPVDEKGRSDREGPQHKVTLTQGFWLGETPVTQAQWEAVTGKNPSHFKGRDLPVEQVSWEDATAFCLRLNEELAGLAATMPTEAQWEYACRAGTASAFNDGSPCTNPTGRDPALERLGWFDKNSNRSTHPVKQKRANVRGLYDMHGNVWEWCLDGMRDYSELAQTDPVGSTEGSADRVLRGGSWFPRARNCRAAFRFRSRPGYRWINSGFRLAAGQEPGTAEPRSPEGQGRKGGSRG